MFKYNIWLFILIFLRKRLLCGRTLNFNDNEKLCTFLAKLTVSAFKVASSVGCKLLCIAFAVLSSKWHTA
jgi:hypothetical protein